MIAFTHNQLLDVTTIASSVPPHLRGIFLRVLAKKLDVRAFNDRALRLAAIASRTVTPVVRGRQKATACDKFMRAIDDNPRFVAVPPTGRGRHDRRGAEGTPGRWLSLVCVETTPRGNRLKAAMASGDVWLVCSPCALQRRLLESRLRDKLLILLARPKRFELLTPRFVVWCSQLELRPRARVGSE
jgi:hypothetical protein